MIKRISITSLYGDSEKNYNINLDRPVTILTGKNGSGKTTILKIINELSNGRLFFLNEYKFQRIECEFDDRILEIKAKPDAENGYQIREKLKGKKFTEVNVADLDEFIDSIPSSILGSIEDEIEELDQMATRRWRNIETGERYDAKEVVLKYFQRTKILKEYLTTSGKIGSLSKEKSKFIQTGRLTKKIQYERHPKYRTREATATAIEECADKLRDLIKSETSRYLSESQAIDSAFPKRLIKNDLNEISIQELKKIEQQLEEMRASLKAVGLLDTFEIFNINKTDKLKMQVLHLYYRDSIDKLRYLESIQKRLSLFVSLANEKFEPQKRINISPIKGFTIYGGADFDDPINLEWLSSGEQHELVMLYEVIFEVSDNSLTLIDEPEISLHIDWQRRYLDDLNKIQNFSEGRQFIIATHSPAIIGKFRAYCEEVGPEE